MMYFSMLLLLSLAAISSANQCAEFGLDNCAGDEDAIIFEINTSLEICQEYCSITPGCAFYRYDNNPIQESCALYGEDFSIYSSNCDEVSAPKGFANTEVCLAPSTASCDIIQVGKCGFWSSIEETIYLSSANVCAMECSASSSCDMWTYQKKTSRCIMYSNSFPEENRKCNVVFGPVHAKENCDVAN